MTTPMFGQIGAGGSPGAAAGLAVVIFLFIGLPLIYHFIKGAFQIWIPGKRMVSVIRMSPVLALAVFLSATFVWNNWDEWRLVPQYEALAELSSEPELFENFRYRRGSCGQITGWDEVPRTVLDDDDDHGWEGASREQIAFADANALASAGWQVQRYVGVGSQQPEDATREAQVALQSLNPEWGFIARNGNKFLIFKDGTYEFECRDRVPFQRTFREEIFTAVGEFPEPAPVFVAYDVPAEEDQRENPTWLLEGELVWKAPSTTGFAHGIFGDSQAFCERYRHALYSMSGSQFTDREFLELIRDGLTEQGWQIIDNPNADSEFAATNGSQIVTVYDRLDSIGVILARYPAGCVPIAYQ